MVSMSISIEPAVVIVVPEHQEMNRIKTNRIDSYKAFVLDPGRATHPVSLPSSGPRRHNNKQATTRKGKKQKSFFNFSFVSFRQTFACISCRFLPLPFSWHISDNKWRSRRIVVGRIWDPFGKPSTCHCCCHSMRMVRVVSLS
jgi:hypothetical protein